MQVSVVIPVWNGASDIARCLDALLTNSGQHLREVICVDNASADASAELIARLYPRVRLLRQPVNLGFAGGINAGVKQAEGDLFVLLNQDCLVQEGWLAAIVQAYADNPSFGIVGCTILTADGGIDHAGARMTRPGAYGQHLTDTSDPRPRAVDYVTGACMAISRSTWEKAGHLDDGYYPAYYEEADYCYRARRMGCETAYAPAARVVHLRSSREASRDPLKHWVNQHRARYRFVSKHYTWEEFDQFCRAEADAINHEVDADQELGRAAAARDTLRSLADVIERRRIDLADEISPEHRCQLHVGFAQIWRQAFAATASLAPQPVRALGDRDQRQKAANGRIMDSAIGQWLKTLWRPRAPKSTTGGGPEPASEEQIARLRGQLQDMCQALQEENDRLDRRLTILEALTDYDYR